MRRTSRSETDSYNNDPSAWRKRYASELQVLYDMIHDGLSLDDAISKHGVDRGAFDSWMFRVPRNVLAPELGVGVMAIARIKEGMSPYVEKRPRVEAIQIARRLAEETSLPVSRIAAQAGIGIKLARQIVGKREGCSRIYVGNKSIAQDTEERVIRMLSDGAPVGQIARECGCARSTVRKYKLRLIAARSGE